MKRYATARDGSDTSLCSGCAHMFAAGDIIPIIPSHDIRSVQCIVMIDPVIVSCLLLAVLAVTHDVVF